MRISDWSSDVCSSDLGVAAADRERQIVGKLVGALGIDGGRARPLIVAEHEGIVVPCAIGRCRSNQLLEAQDLRHAEIDMLTQIEAAADDIKEAVELGCDAHDILPSTTGVGPVEGERPDFNTGGP